MFCANLVCVWLMFDKPKVAQVENQIYPEEAVKLMGVKRREAQSATVGPGVALTQFHGVLGLYDWQSHSGKPHGVLPCAGGLFALRWNPLGWPHSQSFFLGECPRAKSVAPS